MLGIHRLRIRLGHESLDVTLAYLKGKDAESEEAFLLSKMRAHTVKTNGYTHAAKDSILVAFLIAPGTARLATTWTVR